MHKNVISPNLTYSGFTESPVKINLFGCLSRKRNSDHLLLPTWNFAHNLLCLQDTLDHCFSWLKCSPITVHGNFHCVKFHDFTLTQIFGLVFTFALTYYQRSIFFHTWRTFQLEKNNNFWVVSNCTNAVCKVPCWHKKINVRVLATSARIANKVCPKFWHANFSPYGVHWQNFWNGFWLFKYFNCFKKQS